MSFIINRRKFLGSTAAAAAAFTIVPRHVLGGPGYIPPSEKITLAHIGFGTQAIKEVDGLLSDPNFQLIAVCDVEKDGVNHKEWAKGTVRDAIRRLLQEPTWREGKDWVPGRRDVGKEVIETYYKKHGTTQVVSTYEDFREMLEKEKDLDAVKVMTPDHMHMVASLAAMRKGKHTMVHKPLANRILEGRLIIDTAKKANVMTHFLPAGEGLSVKMVKQWIDEGAIGTLKEIHNWTARPVWPQYTKIPTDKPPIPKDFNWELWLGPVPSRQYHSEYTHTTFRGWFDFGGGAFPDMGIYSTWPIYQTFDLDAPYCVETRPGTVCEVVDGNVCTKIDNDYAFPLSGMARLRFRAKGSRPAIDFFWYEGGMKPPTPEEYAEGDTRDLPLEGMMYVGDKGKILAGFNTTSPRIIPEAKMEEFRKGRNIEKPEPLSPGSWPNQPQGAFPGRSGQPIAARAPRQPEPAGNPLITAIRTGKRSWADFSLCQPITDGHNLVAISYRMGGKKLLWDAEACKITNLPEANKYLTRDYRKGWEQVPSA